MPADRKSARWVNLSEADICRTQSSELQAQSRRSIGHGSEAHGSDALDLMRNRCLNMFMGLTHMPSSSTEADAGLRQSSLCAHRIANQSRARVRSEMCDCSVSQKGPGLDCFARNIHPIRLRVRVGVRVRTRVRVWIRVQVRFRVGVRVR